MIDDPLSITEHDIAEKNLLLRFLRKIIARLVTLADRLSKVEKAPLPPTFADISRELSATGQSPLNVANLLGALAQVQKAGAPRLTSVPTDQILQQYQDTQLILVANGALYDLYTVVAGNPSTLTKLIGGIAAGNMMTTDTDQLTGVTGKKIWTNDQEFDGGVGVGAAPTATVPLNVIKTAAAARFIRIQNLSTSSLAKAIVIANVGDGTNSGRIAYSEYFANETVSQDWIAGMNGTKDFIIRDNTRTRNIVTIDATSATPGSVTIPVTTGGGGLTVTTTSTATRQIFTCAEETITLSTTGTTTDSVVNILPNNGMILGVAWNVITSITGTTTSLQLGDAATTARFDTVSTLTSGNTGVGLNHLQGGIATNAAGPIQLLSTKLRITASSIPTGGSIKTSVYTVNFVST